MSEVVVNRHSPQIWVLSGSVIPPRSLRLFPDEKTPLHQAAEDARIGRTHGEPKRGDEQMEWITAFFKHERGREGSKCC